MLNEPKPWLDRLQGLKQVEMKWFLEFKRREQCTMPGHLLDIVRNSSLWSRNSYVVKEITTCAAVGNRLHNAQTMRGRSGGWFTINRLINNVLFARHNFGGRVARGDGRQVNIQVNSVFIFLRRFSEAAGPDPGANGQAHRGAPSPSHARNLQGGAEGGEGQRILQPRHRHQPGEHEFLLERSKRAAINY